MNNLEIATILEEIGDLLEILGESSFRFNAYHNAARVIRSWPQEVRDVRKTKPGLTSIQGVGKGLAERIEELLDTGRMSYFEELKSRLPESVVELMHIQGLGPKKAKLVYDSLGVKSVEELYQAALGHRLRDLPGMGPKSEANILRGIQLHEQQISRLLLIQAVPNAEAIIKYLRALPEVVDVAPAGSLRRWQETIGDIDILVGASDPDKVGDAFCHMEDVTSVLAQGETKCSVLLHSGLQIDLRMVGPDQFGAALQYFTGSKAHNIHLRELARKKGLKISEYGVFEVKTGKLLASRTEEDVYAAMGLPYIEPTLREDNGEIEAAAENKLPHLIESGDIKGDLHCHTDASDGQSTLAEMVDFARSLGYAYLVISDHAEKLKVARGLGAERLEAQWQSIAELNASLQDFHIFAGSEMNIDNNGDVDWDDDFLARFDFLSASIHTGFGQERDVITKRVVAAMENPRVRMICHPTGRVLGRRPAYAIDMPTIFEAAARTGTLLELSAFPDRLDLNAENLREAARYGVKFAINTDAHHFGQLAYMRYGVMTAQRGWLEPESVVNTFSLAKLTDYMKTKRRAAQTSPRTTTQR